MKLQKKSFGKTKNGEKATLYILENKNGTKVTVSDYGATVVGIFTADKNGKFDDIALGYDDVSGYENNPTTYYGAFVGPNCNRIKNAEFCINGKTYRLDANKPGNINLHSGLKCFKDYMFEAEIIDDQDDSLTVEFSRLRPDMEQGFPGNLDVTVSYTLTESDELVIEFYAVSDADTVVNLTNHSFFNLGGQASGSMLDTMVRINADRFTPTDDTLVPTGELRDVTGTPMDFREFHRIGDRIDSDYEPLNQSGGYDQNYCLNKKTEDCELAAEAYDPKTGRKLEVFTDLPGMQFYCGNFIEGNIKGKGGRLYQKRDAFCFETQLFPDACHEKPGFKSSVLKAGEPYESTTVFRFSVI